MKRALLVLPVLLLVACEHGSNAPAEIEPRSKRESAAGLLRVELQLAVLEDFLRYTPGIPSAQSRLDAVRFLRAHIGRCKRWLAATETDRRLLAAASVGLDLAGVGYDLIRADLEATLRHLSGIARRPANIGLDAVWRGVSALERDPSSALTRAMTGELLEAEERRNALLKILPAANDLRPGVLAASNTSGAYGLAKAATAAGPVLGRVAGFMAGSEGAAVGVEVSAGRAVAISVGVGGGAIALTDAEVIALAQAGAISATAIQLLMMANGRPPKVPDPRKFAEWAGRAPTQPPKQPDSEPTKFQVKYAGPIERLLEASTGEKVWADGVREADCRILEAKLVTKPRISPFLENSEPFHEVLRDNIRDQFKRYAAIIQDPSSPAVALEVITNDARAVPFFESILQELGVPGEVIVRPYP